jgi:NAD+ diphosphatase
LVYKKEPQVRLPFFAELADLGLSVDSAHYLGRLGQADCFALSAPPGLEPVAKKPPGPEKNPSAAARPALPDGFALQSLRKLYGVLDEERFAVAGRAMQIVYWDDTHRFCGRCGTALLRQAHERAKRCPSCELLAFPRLSPAVIVLVRKGTQALLARAARFPTAMYSTLAGFVEPGESLEETVEREIQEEVGITVKNVRYFGSQPWPFPHSLMVGFLADYADGELRPDGEEIVDARWFSKDALPQIPPPLSIARQLINSWIDEKVLAPAALV